MICVSLPGIFWCSLPNLSWKLVTPPGPERIRFSLPGVASSMSLAPFRNNLVSITYGFNFWKNLSKKFPPPPSSPKLLQSSESELPPGPYSPSPTSAHSVVPTNGNHPFAFGFRAFLPQSINDAIISTISAMILRTFEKLVNAVKSISKNLPTEVAISLILSIVLIALRILLKTLDTALSALQIAF